MSKFKYTKENGIENIIMIKEAAIKKDGKVYTGKNHSVIINSAQQLGLGFGGLKGGEQGFVDFDGNFYNREESGRIALACGQIKKLGYFGGKELDSSDLYRDFYKD